MNHDIKLEVYSFALRGPAKLGKPKSYYPLTAVQGKSDFYNTFAEFIKYLESKLVKFDSDNKAIRIKINNDGNSQIKVSSSSRLISGIFESGNYGYESDIISITDPKKKTKKTKDDCEVLPFYFLISIPKDKDHGFIVLQRFGVFGINSIFKKVFYSFYKDQFTNLLMDINPVVSKELADDFFENGKVRELVFTKLSLPSDKADRIGLKNFIADSISIEIRIKAKRNKVFNMNGYQIKSFITDPNSKFFKLGIWDTLGLDEQTKVSIVSKVGKRERMIDLDEEGAIRPYYDISADVKLDNTGHPNFESIDSVAKDLLNKIKNG